MADQTVKVVRVILQGPMGPGGPGLRLGNTYDPTLAYDTNTLVYAHSGSYASKQHVPAVDSGGSAPAVDGDGKPIETADWLPVAAAGVDGEDGDDGVNGLSAYQIWLAAGNTGNLGAYLASLKGDPGGDITDETEALYAGAVEARDEAVAASDKLKVVDGLNGRTVFVDGNGYIFILVEADGRFRSATTDGISAQADIGAAIGVYSKPVEGLNGLTIFSDAAGYIYGRLARDGTATFLGLSGSTSAAPTYEFHLTGEIMLWILYGQSLSRGQGAAAISTSAIAHALKFVGGVRADDGGTDPAVVYASLVPFTEQLDTDGGETGLSGFMRMFQQSLQGDNSIDFGDWSQQFLLGCPGLGGLSATELSPGTAYFDRLKDYISYGFTRAQALGKSFSVPGMSYTQGEQDQHDQTEPSTWQGLVRMIRETAEAWAQSVCGNSEPLPMFLSILSDHSINNGNAGTYPSIALAQTAMCKSDPLYIATTPYYMMPPHVAGDVHLCALGYIWLYAYHGRAMKMLFNDGVKYRPLDAKAAWNQGKSVIIEMDVQSGTALAFDTTIVADPGDYGLSVFDPGANAYLTPTSVTLYGRDKIKMTFASAVPDGCRFRAGFNGTPIGSGNTGPLHGPRCCLRDSDPHILVDQAGQTVIQNEVTAWNTANPTLPVQYPIPLYRFAVYIDLEIS